MSTQHPIALIAAVVAGVLLPKALPAAIVGGSMVGAWERFLRLLPAATLAALAALTTLKGDGGLVVRPQVLMAVGVAAAVAAITRRSLVAMAGGWAAALLIGLLNL